MVCVISATTQVRIELLATNTRLLDAAVTEVARVLGMTSSATKSETGNPAWELRENRQYGERFLILTGGKGITLKCTSGYPGEARLNTILGSVESVYKSLVAWQQLRARGFTVKMASQLGENGRIKVAMSAEK